MREILETEEHVPVPPIMYSDPFYRITYLIKEEIRKYKWIEGEKGRKLSWERARQEWTDAHREKYEKFLIDTLYFPDATLPEEPPAEEQHVRTANRLLGKVWTPIRFRSSWLNWSRTRLINAMKEDSSCPDGSNLTASLPSVKSICTQCAPLSRQPRISVADSLTKSSRNFSCG